MIFGYFNIVSRNSNSLPTVVIGGLITLNFLTFLVLPIIYSWLEEECAKKLVDWEMMIERE